ncbi:MAG TPA: hypothetical protein VFV09_02940 [Actinomycetota bacterium]|jgi:predicted histidine transporter YuiF (NhaC family)|nr:hypothetical protein [Actinomycetota bacterium]
MQRSWKDSAVSLIVAGTAVLFGIGASTGTVPLFAILITLMVGLTALSILPVAPYEAPEEAAVVETPVQGDLHVAA